MSGHSTGNDHDNNQAIPSDGSVGAGRVVQWSAFLLIVVAVLSVIATRPADPPEHGPASGPLSGGKEFEFLRLMNRGKAHLENGANKEAIAALTAALDLRPNSGPARRNLARAYLFSGEPDAAIARLKATNNRSQDQKTPTPNSSSAAADFRPEDGGGELGTDPENGSTDSAPDSVAATYLVGLAHARQNDFETAIPFFEKAASLDAGTAAIRFQLARAYKATGNDKKAIEQFEETVRLDPQHSAAQFQLAMHARKTGNLEEYRRRLREYVRLRDLYGDLSSTPLALEACSHTKAEPPTPGEDSQASGPPAQEIGVRFTDATEEVFAETADRSAVAVAILDLDDEGRYTIFVAGTDGHLSLMTLTPGGTFSRKPLELALGPDADINRCVVGNFHDDTSTSPTGDVAVRALRDVIVIGEENAYLLKRVDSNVFEDVTQSAGLTSLGGRAARWVDYEYDGDFDLLVAGKDALELWQNNGDGTFRNVTTDVGIGESILCQDMEAVDLDSNGGVDLIAARGAAPTRVFENQRAGRFAPMPEPPGPWPSARRVLANDVNNDGHPDVLLIGETQVTILLGGSVGRQRIDLSGFRLAEGTLVDYDNDGWLDFCGVGRSEETPEKGEIRIWRNARSEDWPDVTADLGLDAITTSPLRDVIAADLDADDDTDLLLVTEDAKLRFLRNDGGHENGQLKLRLFSLMSGIGTHIEFRKDDFWVTRSVQQEWPVEIGLAGHRKLDTVQTIWINGIVDNRIDVIPTGKPLDILILKFAVTGSCPYLYAWDGQRFRFVTDLLGSGTLGLSLSREAVWTPDPHEIVRIGESDQIRPRDGAYLLQVTGELREVNYLDYFQILAVDHPRNIEIHSTDKFMLPPFSRSELWGLGDRIGPRRAEGDDGIDRTNAIAEIDGVFAPPGQVLPPPLRGVCRPMTITLDFGDLDTTRPLVLALTGWLEYGNASSNVGLSQNSSVEVIWPVLEAETADGDWVTLDINVGMPAGKTKTILCDLAGKLPLGAKRLRLTTTFEIRWDRIALFQRRPTTEFSIHELPVRQANLNWRGFSEIRSRAPGHPQTPAHDIVFAQPPWRTTLEGWCTRYGDVHELVSHADGKVAVVNSGDSLTLKFQAENVPPCPSDRVRTFFLYSVGWDKEENANTVDGDKVEPLPGRFVSAPDEPDANPNDWRLRFNTRWVPRFRFGPPSVGIENDE